MGSAILPFCLFFFARHTRSSPLQPGLFASSARPAENHTADGRRGGGHTPRGGRATRWRGTKTAACGGKPAAAIPRSWARTLATGSAADALSTCAGCSHACVSVLRRGAGTAADTGTDGIMRRFVPPLPLFNVNSIESQLYLTDFQTRLQYQLHLGHGWNFGIFSTPHRTTIHRPSLPVLGRTIARRTLAPPITAGTCPRR